MTSFLKKYWLFLFLVIIIFVLFLVRVFLSPKEVPQTSPEKLPRPRFIQAPVSNQFINYQFSFSGPADLPSSLPVYKVLNLKTDAFPEITPDLAGESVISSDSAAMGLAKSFLEEKGVEENFLNLSQVNYRRVEKTETFPATASSEIDIFVVNFWPTIEKIAVVSDTPNSPLSSVWLGKNGRAQKVFSTSFSLEEKGAYPLRSLAVANQDLLGQKGTLVWLEEEELYESGLSKTVEAVILDRVSLAYFLPPKNLGILEPIYVFEGRAVLGGEEKTRRAAVYLPAIEEKFLFP